MNFFLLLLPALGIISCSGSADPRDKFGAFNTNGGAHRSNYSSAHVSPVSALEPRIYSTLQGGFRVPPLDVGRGTMAIISGGDDRVGPSLVLFLGDSIYWRYNYPNDEYPMPGIAADSAGIIYTVSSRGLLRAIDRQGRSLWKNQIGQGGDSGGINVPSLPLALSNGVAVGNSQGWLTRYNAGGEKLWNIRRGGAISDNLAGDPAVGLVAAITHNSYDQSDTVLLLDPSSGVERWRRAIEGGRIVAGPAIVGGMIVIGAVSRSSDDRREPFALAFAADGRRLWRSPLVLIPRGIAGDNVGSIYISCSGVGQTLAGGAVVSLDSTGKMRWEVTLESSVTAAPLVGADRIYFIARSEGRTGLYTYGRDGVFSRFLSIDLVPDVLAQGMINSYGRLILAGLDQPVLLQGLE